MKSVQVFFVFSLFLSVRLSSQDTSGRESMTLEEALAQNAELQKNLMQAASAGKALLNARLILQV